MPIDIEQFKEATKDLEQRILEFLEKHPDKAYSLLEIIGEFENKSDPKMVGLLILLERSGGQKSATWDRYEKAISALTRRNAVSAAQLQGTTYYAYMGEKK